MIEVASIVVFSDRVEQTIAFYRALGVPLEDEDHGDGAQHAAGEAGGIHIAVLPASGRPVATPAWREQGSTFVGFWVDSLDVTLAGVQALGAEVLLDHQACEWGCRVVVADPDGRAVEINQGDHCDPGATG